MLEYDIEAITTTRKMYYKSTDHGSDDSILFLCWFGLCYNVKHL